MSGGLDTPIEKMIAMADARYEKYKQDEIANIKQVREAIILLREQGFDVRHTGHGYYMDLHIEVKDLQRVYRAVGSLELSNKSVAWDSSIGKDSHDTIDVTVRSKRFPCVKFTYKKKLPPVNSGARKKCRIVTETYTDTRTMLVCSVDPDA